MCYLGNRHSWNIGSFTRGKKYNRNASDYCISPSSCICPLCYGHF